MPRPRAVSVKHPEPQTTQVPKFDFAKIGKSKRLAKQNKDYLDLLSIVEKSRFGFVAEQASLKSKPAKDAAKQLLRQLDLILHMVRLPHGILIMMEGYVDGYRSVVEKILLGTERNQRKTFERQYRSTMQRFFALDVSGALSRPWLFAITLYIWTAYECLAGDLWAASVNQATTLGHHLLSSIGSDDKENLGLSRRQIDVGLAARYGFDLRHSLGTILKPKFDFRSFSGIEDAYNQAFGACGKPLEEYRITLKELEQIRHLIVHRGGVVDERFAQVSKRRVMPDKIVPLRLSQVGLYMMSVTMGCVALLRVVDEWFMTQK